MNEEEKLAEEIRDAIFVLNQKLEKAKELGLQVKIEVWGRGFACSELDSLVVSSLTKVTTY